MADFGGDEKDPDVGFLYKTMLERDPRKRRVKPVSKHLLQLDFGGLDSSDDSDFEVAEHQDSDDSDEGSMDEDEDESKESGSEDAEEGEECEMESEGGSEGGGSISLADLLDAAKKQKILPISEDTSASGSSAQRLRVRICCVCLGEVSEEEDEIVECDSCNVLVHEGCYGISESQSVASTESSASTEPWFCDACKAGVKPYCELCPNSGGIYKETDAGKWVHIVCALYIPGVAFGDVDRLSPVTLFELPYHRWGARECSLCEDLRFSRTGICIGCDAGMCRCYFHVTCAQREGLLSEASPDEEIADPFYAYCRQHAEKSTARVKRRNWLAVQSRLKQMNTTIASHPDAERVKRKLNRHRQKYIAAKQKRPPVWVPKEKVPRMLTTSPHAMRLLLRKAELMGLNTQVDHTTAKDIRKKWHVAPAFSVEFVSYFLDRNVRMNHMKTRLKELLQSREELHKEEEAQREVYDKLSNEVKAQKEANESVRTAAMHLWNMLQDISPKLLIVPPLLRQKSPTRPHKPGKDIPKSPTSIIHPCKVCRQTTKQHLLAKCDSCHQHYHLGCLDPPLTRMPKKTKMLAWHCSECSQEERESISPKKADPNAPRRLREKVKMPKKFMPQNIPIINKKPKMKAKAPKGQKKVRSPQNKMSSFGRKRKIINFDNDDEDDKQMPVLKKERPLRIAKIKRKRDLRTECCICLKEGDNSNLVRCDECQLCYHFGCLKPPVKKSPKYRGYAWLCTACDPASDKDGDEAMEMTEDNADNPIEIDDDNDENGDNDDNEDNDNDEPIYYDDDNMSGSGVDIVEGTVAEDCMYHSESSTPSSIIEIPDDPDD